WGQGRGTEGSFDEGTILDYAAQTTQSNGVDVVGDRFTIADLAIVDAKKDGLRVEDSDQVTIQRVRATWREVGSSDNGAYGLYPVKVSRVLMEDSEAYNSSDAGIYVGQCQHAVVRNNIAMGNVAGIEIENTQFADVYGNYAEDNTGGLVIFDLPGNPVVGRDVSVHDNTVVNNNRTNFAPQGSTVAAIPPGTGTFAMASRRVEIFDNTYEDNNSFDIAVISGLPIQGDPEQWKLAKSELVGDVEGLNLLEDDTGDFVYNYRSDNAYVHGNTHTNTGSGAPNTDFGQELGLLLQIVYGANPIDAVLYDAWGETSFDSTDPSLNSNDNHICVADSAADGATFASLNMEYLIANGGVFDDLFRPAEPYAPFDCDTFISGPLQPPSL
ncbi:MAG: parallel beta-helix domain-containing protein, partial [Nannocystaceae bacterium]